MTGPPVTEPVKVEIVHEVGSEPRGESGNQIARLQGTLCDGARNSLLAPGGNAADVFLNVRRHYRRRAVAIGNHEVELVADFVVDFGFGSPGLRQG